MHLQAVRESSVHPGIVIRPQVARPSMGSDMLPEIAATRAVLTFMGQHRACDQQGKKDHQQGNQQQAFHGVLTPSAT